jgi:hypothetical protein
LPKEQQQTTKEEQPQKKYKRLVFDDTRTGSEIILGLGQNSQLRWEAEQKKKAEEAAKTAPSTSEPKTDAEDR